MKEDTDEQKLRKKLRKIIELTTTIDSKGGTVWGMDTDCGNIEELIDEAMEIIKEEE